jgi:hypothetical protein
MSDGGKPSNPIISTVDAVEQKIAFWGAMAKYIGWPGVILIFLGYCTYNVGTSCYPFVKNIAESHVTVVTGLLEQQKIQNALKDESNRILEKVNETQKDQGVLIEEIHKAVMKPNVGSTAPKD